MSDKRIHGFRGEMRAARERLAALGSRAVSTPYGAVRFAEAGTGPPVLVAHGILGGYDAGLLYARLNRLDEDFHVVAPVRFGYLGSAMPPDPSPALQADAFAALLDALGIDRVGIVGLSAGSPSTLQFAIRHADRVSALVLASANVPGPHLDRDVLPRRVARVLWGSDLLMWAICRYAPRPIEGLMGVPPGLPLSDAGRAFIARQFETFFPISERTDGILFDAFRSNRDINRGYPLGEITAPALVVHAEDDPGPPFRAAAELAAQIPGARLLAVERGGHLMLGEHPEVAREIVALLRRTAAPS
jgi:pimeloyl-ACP methyl ester carboxylesterase